MDKLRDDEFNAICAAQTEKQYYEAVDQMKRARNGEYPPDWWPRMVQSGMLRKISARWGGDDRVRMITGDGGYFPPPIEPISNQ